VKYIYTITMIVDIIADSSSSAKYAKYGRIDKSRLLAWEPSKKKAIEIVENNVMNIWDNGFNYAVIEKVAPGLWASCKEELWYK